MGKITYYNFNSGYPDDVSTSGCGVTKGSIDENFYNLKSADVKTAYWDNEINGITIVFNDGKKIAITDIDPYHLEYNDVESLLTGVTVDGKQFSIKGSQENPLSKAVIGIVTEYPEGIETINARYILKEKHNVRSRVYTKKEVLAIDAYLKKINSPWRVATKADWDGLLNAMEICDEDRNHGMEFEGGRIAGDILKDNILWNGSNNYEFGIAPYIDDAPYAAIDGEDVLCKVFDEESGPVYTSSEERDHYLIRLVKDAAFSGIYDILGNKYTAQAMPFWTNEEMARATSALSFKVWIMTDFIGTKLGTKKIGKDIPGENEHYSFYIIENTAPEGPEKIQWSSYKMKEGDSVFSLNDNTTYTLRKDDNGEYLERLNDIYNSSIVKSYYNDDDKAITIEYTEDSVIKSVSLNISSLIDNIDTQFSELNLALSEEIENRKEGDKELSDSMIALSGDLITYIDSKTSTVYRVKGSLETYDDLLAVSNPLVGDVYNIIESGVTITGKEFAEGSNFVWTGKDWDILGGTFDFTELEHLKQDVKNLSAGTIADLAKLSADTTSSIKGLSGSVLDVIEKNELITAAAFNVLKSAQTVLSGSVMDFSAATVEAISNMSGDTGNKIQELSAATVEALTNLSADTENAIKGLSGSVINVIEENELITAAAFGELSGSVIDLSAETIAGIIKASADTVALEDMVKIFSASTISLIAENEEITAAALTDLDYRLNLLNADPQNPLLTYAKKDDINNIFNEQ